MSVATNLRNGRIVGPVPYVQGRGKQVNIPLGPCLLEPLDDDRVDVFWGASGQRSTVLSMTDLEAARASGNLVLLDTDT